MKCLACGAEMRLIDIRTDTTTPFPIERRVFQCLSCRQTAQRLGFDRSGLPDRTSPVLGLASAPAIRFHPRRHAAGSTKELAAERPSDTKGLQVAQEPVDWRPVVSKLSSALQVQASAVRAAAWAKTLEKLRSRQMALKAQIVPLRTADREFDRIWNGPRRDEARHEGVSSAPEVGEERGAA
jgi:hypothetical protein